MKFTGTGSGFYLITDSLYTAFTMWIVNALVAWRAKIEVVILWDLMKYFERALRKRPLTKR